MNHSENTKPSPYYLGALAKQQGKLPTDCPYPVGEQHDEWMLGWVHDRGQNDELQSNCGRAKPFIRLETNRFNSPSSFRLWCWGIALRIALLAGYPVVLVGACRTGKTLLLGKMTPGKIIDKREEAMHGKRPVISETDLPDGLYSLDECQRIEPNSFGELMTTMIGQKRPFCLATQHYETVKDAVDVYRATESAKRVLLVVVGGRANPSAVLRELPQ